MSRFGADCVSHFDVEVVVAKIIKQNQYRQPEVDKSQIRQKIPAVQKKHREYIDGWIIGGYGMDNRMDGWVDGWKIGYMGQAWLFRILCQ